MAVTISTTVALDNYAAAYVDEQTGYGSDNIKVTLDDATFEVKAFPVDQYGAQLAGSNLLVDETMTSLKDAIALYNSLIRQLNEGDVIRNPNPIRKPAGVVTDPNDINVFEP